MHFLEQQLQFLHGKLSQWIHAVDFIRPIVKNILNRCCGKFGWAYSGARGGKFLCIDCLQYRSQIMAIFTIFSRVPISTPF